MSERTRRVKLAYTWREVRSFLLSYTHQITKAIRIGEDRQWPPRSPYEAILSSPSGRKKLQQRQQRSSPSPSPVKKGRLVPAIGEGQKDEDAEDDDDDEETLQLKLQALEAKLKLKRLQNRKAKDGGVRIDVAHESGGKELLRAPSGLSERRNGTLSGASLHRSRSVGDIQVPLSPERRPVVQQEQRSPGRVLLGIDKGLSAKNVSLRRPPGLRNGAPSHDQFGGVLKHSNTAVATNSSSHLSPDNQVTVPMSFNERMAQARNREKSDKERQERVSKLRSERSASFRVRNEEIVAFKEAAETASAGHRNTTQQVHDRAFSRNEILNAASKPAGGLIRRSNTTSSIRGGRESRAPSVLGHSRPGSKATMQTSQHIKHSRAGSVSLSDESRPATPADPTLFEGFSRTNLSARILPHSFVSRMVEDKMPAILPTLLKEVKAPDFELPPELIEKDLVVFAIIASKSEPRAHKQTHTASKSNGSKKTAEEEAAESEANENGKYMIFTLTDLKWTVDLFLFRTAFTRWHKLQPGTLIAILNPTVMPPPKGRVDTGRWSFTLNSSDDTVLEIGTAKDLGWCKAKTKNRRDCNDWVDTRKTEFCEFHVNRGVEGLRRGRMEVQGMSAPFGPGGKGGGAAGNGYLNSMRGRKGLSSGKDNGLLKEGRQFDRHTQSSYFMVSRNATAASLLDADEGGDLHGTREDRQRKLHASQERERDIARKLGQSGNGAGAEYLRARNGDVMTYSDKRSALIDPSDTAIDAKSLGLKSNHATNVMLSPLKRKPSIRTIGYGNAAAAADPSGPQKKKTRFITDKGIREAGRDSLGVDELNILYAKHDNHNNDDDELDIV